MRRTAAILFTAALALGAVAADDDQTDDEQTVDEETTDETTHPCYDEEAEDVTYEEQQFWFHEGDSKVGNLAGPAPWDTNPPEASVQDGAGAGTLTPGFATLGGDANQFATFAGTFNGCIDTLLFDVYSFDPSNRSGTGASGEPSPHNFGLTVTVDGVEVFSGGPLEANTTLTNEGVGPNLNQFALDISSTMELLADLEQLELDGEHQVEVNIRSWYVNTGHSIYVWDTTEVPSGITFNGEVTEDYASL